MPFITAIAGYISSLLASSVARFVAFKLLLSFLFITILPIILNNFFYSIVQIALNHVSNATSDVHSFTLQLTGLAAYLASHLQLVSALSVLLSAVSIRFTLKVFHIS